LGLFIINTSRGAKRYALHVAKEFQKAKWFAGIAAQ
tara:strand:- start:346 stop:453 length:108 start_codon:yes stop_codon:yes gene_type:complete